MNAVTTRPTISTHPARRARRPSHGAAAVSIAATAAMPAVDTCPSVVSGPRSAPTLDQIEPPIGLHQWVEPTEDRHGQHSGDRDGDQHPPSTPIQDPRQPASQHDQAQDARPDHDGGDDPVRDGVESAEQSQTRTPPACHRTATRQQAGSAPPPQRRRDEGCPLANAGSADPSRRPLDRPDVVRRVSNRDAPDVQ